MPEENVRTSLADSTVLNEAFANAPLKEWTRALHVLVLFRILRADMKTVGVLDGKCRIFFHLTIFYAAEYY